MHYLRGLAVVMAGSAIAVVSSLIDALSARSFALFAQSGPSPPAAILGVVGLITAFGGIALQAYDKAIARRKVELDHQYRIYLVEHNCDQLSQYVRASREQVLMLRRMCEAANLQIPPDIGPPPELIGHGRG